MIFFPHGYATRGDDHIRALLRIRQCAGEGITDNGRVVGQMFALHLGKATLYKQLDQLRTIAVINFSRQRCFVRRL